MFKQIKAVAISAASLLVAASPVFAAAVVSTTTAKTVGSTFGAITDFTSIIIFIYNFAYYLGWFFVIAGIIVALATLAYKLFFGDGEEAMKTVQSYMTKVVIIVIVGFLLLSASFVFSFIGSMIGISTGVVFSPTAGIQL